MNITAFLFAFIGEQLTQDIPFLIIVAVLSHFNLVTIEFPSWFVNWFEAQDLAPVAPNLWRIQ